MSGDKKRERNGNSKWRNKLNQEVNYEIDITIVELKAHKNYIQKTLEKDKSIKGKKFNSFTKQNNNNKKVPNIVQEQ